MSRIIEKAQAAVTLLQAHVEQAVSHLHNELLTAAGVAKPDAYYSQWKQHPERRREFIGGSDIAAVLNDPESNRTAIDVWREKKGLAEPFEGNALTEAGHRLEPTIVQWWADLNPDVIVIPTDQTWSHPKYHFLAASTDAILIYPDNVLGVLETKNVNQFMADRWVQGEESPSPYIWQTASNAHIIGAERCVIFGLCGGNDPREYRFDYDPAFGEHIEREAVRFWELVQGDEPPDVTINHKNARSSLGDAYVFIDHDDFELELDEETARHALDYPQLSAQAKEADAQKSAAVAAVTQALGKAGARIATVNQQPVMSWNFTNHFDIGSFAMPDLAWYGLTPAEIKKRYPKQHQAAMRPAHRTIRAIKPKDTK